MTHPTIQKFHRGDLVRIHDELSSFKSHFQHGCDAIVVGSYHDQFNCGSNSTYTLYLKERGEVSWYDEEDFTFIMYAPELLKQWKKEDKEVWDRHSDIDWIFENGIEVSEKAYGHSLATLAEHLGCPNLWGAHGEGLSYYTNSMRALSLSRVFLLENDKAGFLEFAREAAPLITWTDYQICG